MVVSVHYKLLLLVLLQQWVMRLTSSLSRGSCSTPASTPLSRASRSSGSLSVKKEEERPGEGRVWSRNGRPRPSPAPRPTAWGWGDWFVGTGWTMTDWSAISLSDRASMEELPPSLVLSTRRPSGQTNRIRGNTQNTQTSCIHIMTWKAEVNVSKLSHFFDFN